MKLINFISIYFFLMCLLSCDNPENQTDKSKRIKGSLYASITDGSQSNYYYEFIENDNFNLFALNIKGRLTDTLNFNNSNLKDGVITTVMYYSDDRNIKNIDIDTNNIFICTIRQEKDSLTIKIKKLSSFIFQYSIYIGGSNLGISLPFIIDQDSINDCWENYLNNIYPILLAKANHDCKTYFYCLACPESSPVVFYLIVINPTSIICNSLENNIIHYILTKLPLIYSVEH